MLHRFHSPKLALTAAAALAVAAPAAAQQGALELFVGETLFVGGTRASVTWLHDDGDPITVDGNRIDRDRDVVVTSWATNIQRGLDLALVLPWISNDAEFAGPAGVLDSDKGGIGDLAFVLKKRVYQDLWERGAWNVAVLGGVETPTGETSKKLDGALLSPGLQPGSGSWDPFVGVASTWEQGRFRADVQAFYQTFGEGDQDFTAGDVASIELDVGYRVLMTQYPGPTVSAKTGLRWRHRERAEQGGTTLGNSGGEELAALIASTWHPSPEWDVSFRIETPIGADLNGTQIESDVRLFLGLGLRF